jgi:REP element-mobilizing transposase RayT
MDKKGLDVYAWVIMTSHVHMIVGSHGEPLAGIMRDMKAHTSKTLHDMLKETVTESRKDWMLPMMVRTGIRNPNNRDFQLWQQEFYPKQLLTAEMAQQKLDYIHYNPVKAGFVAEPHHYLYSSAADYAGMPGLINIIHLF